MHNSAFCAGKKETLGVHACFISTVRRFYCAFEGTISSPLAGDMHHFVCMKFALLSKLLLHGLPSFNIDPAFPRNLMFCNTLQKPIMDRLGEAYDSPEKVHLPEFY